MEHHLGQAHEDTCEDMHEAQRDSFLPPGHTAERGKTAFGSGSTHLIKSQGFFFSSFFFLKHDPSLFGRVRGINN